MTVQSHLKEIADSSVMKTSEKDSIKRSIDTLKSRLNSHFDDELSEQMLFGSYTRNTILPRKFDDLSDVDYMIVFKDGSSKPQTYLDRLRRFVEKYYYSSEIKQSNPTIQLELNHIRFELVPAKKYWWDSDYQIPAKASDYQDWQATDPNGFNDRLVNANQSNKSLIKPLVRVLKYWNVNNSRPFDSYELEQAVVDVAEGIIFTSSYQNLRDHLYNFSENYSTPWSWASWRKDKVQRLKDACAKAKELEEDGYPATAESEIKKVIPACLVC
jgi:predicted nucleotidyltransferase